MMIPNKNFTLLDFTCLRSLCFHILWNAVSFGFVFLWKTDQLLWLWRLTCRPFCSKVIMRPRARMQAVQNMLPVGEKKCQATCHPFTTLYGVGLQQKFPLFPDPVS